MIDLSDLILAVMFGCALVMSYRLKISPKKDENKAKLAEIKARTGLNEENLIEVFARTKFSKMYETKNLRCFAILHNQLIVVVLVSEYNNISIVFFDEPEEFKEWFIV